MSQESLAVIQAILAAATVITTVVLAVIAWGALRASGVQARAAGDAVREMQRTRDEMRRQTAVTFLPTLTAAEPLGDFDLARQGRFVTYIDIANIGSSPIFGIEAEIREGDAPAPASSFVYAAARESLLLPSGERRIEVDSQDLLNTRVLTPEGSEEVQQKQGRGERPPLYQFDHLLITFRWRSALGCAVEQSYQWRPNSDPLPGGAPTWRLSHFQTVPDPRVPGDVVEIELV